MDLHMPSHSPVEYWPTHSKPNPHCNGQPWSQSTAYNFGKTKPSHAPVEYCPSSSTDGLASKSLSCSSGVKKLPNLNWSSRGRTYAAWHVGRVWQGAGTTGFRCTAQSQHHQGEFFC